MSLVCLVLLWYLVLVKVRRMSLECLVLLWYLVISLGLENVIGMFCYFVVFGIS